MKLHLPGSMPPCIHFGSCGGCQWQSAAYEAQLDWKRSIVSDQLTHLGRLPDAEVRETIAPGPPYGYRNRMDFKLVNGQPALSRAASHELVEIQKCHLMVPTLEKVFNELPTRPEAQPGHYSGGSRHRPDRGHVR